MESPQQKAKRVINEHPGLDPDFEKKFEEVRPVLEQYEKEGKFDNIAERAAENNAKFAAQRREREEMEEPQIAEVISTILHTERSPEKSETSQGHVKYDGSWTDESKKPRSIIFGADPTKEEIEAAYKKLPKEESYSQKMAKNHLSMVEHLTLDTNEKRTRNRINFMQRADRIEADRQKKKTVAQQLMQWWKGLDDKDRLN